MALLTARTRHPERMDEPDVEAPALRASLRFIERVNRWLGGTAAVRGALAEMARSWRGRPVAILDLGTGGADIPLALERWAAAAGHDVRITGLEPHPLTAGLAAERAAAAAPGRIRIVRGDARNPPFPPRAFDYVLASMMLHHLPDIEILTVLKRMERLARCGLIVNDLLRSPLSTLGVRLITMAAPEMARHDARVSVQAGFTPEEAQSLRDRAGLGYLHFSRRFAGRFVLAGHRPDAPREDALP